MCLVQHSEDLDCHYNRLQCFFSDFYKVIKEYKLDIVYSPNTIAYTNKLTIYSDGDQIYKSNLWVFDRNTYQSGYENGGYVVENIVQKILDVFDKYRLYMCGVYNVELGKKINYVCFSNNMIGNFYEIYHLPGLKVNADTIAANFWDMKSLWPEFEKNKKYESSTK